MKLNRYLIFAQNHVNDKEKHRFKIGAFLLYRKLLFCKVKNAPRRCAKAYGFLFVRLFPRSFFLFGSLLFCSTLLIFGFFFHFFRLVNQLFNQHTLYKYIKT